MIRFRIAAQILPDAELTVIKHSRTPLTIDAQPMTCNELLEEQWEALQKALAPCPYCNDDGGSVEIGDTDQGQEEAWIECARCGGRWSA